MDAKSITLRADFDSVVLQFLRVPGNSAAVTALQEELNHRGIENVCLEEEVQHLYFCSFITFN